MTLCRRFFRFLAQCSNPAGSPEILSRRACYGDRGRHGSWACAHGNPDEVPCPFCGGDDQADYEPRPARQVRVLDKVYWDRGGSWLKGYVMSMVRIAGAIIRRYVAKQGQEDVG